MYSLHFYLLNEKKLLHRPIICFIKASVRMWKPNVRQSHSSTCNNPENQSPVFWRLPPLPSLFSYFLYCSSLQKPTRRCDLTRGQMKWCWRCGSVDLRPTRLNTPHTYTSKRCLRWGRAWGPCLQAKDHLWETWGKVYTHTHILQELCSTFRRWQEGWICLFGVTFGPHCV